MNLVASRTQLRIGTWFSNRTRGVGILGLSKTGVCTRVIEQRLNETTPNHIEVSINLIWRFQRLFNRGLTAHRASPVLSIWVILASVQVFLLWFSVQSHSLDLIAMYFTRLAAIPATIINFFVPIL